MLVAAAWIAVASKDKDIPILLPTEAERIAAEHKALLLAAQVRLRTAREARAAAPWYRAWRADFAAARGGGGARRASRRRPLRCRRPEEGRETGEEGGGCSAAASEHVRGDR